MPTGELRSTREACNRLEVVVRVEGIEYGGPGPKWVSSVLEMRFARCKGRLKDVGECLAQDQGGRGLARWRVVPMAMQGDRSPPAQPAAKSHTFHPARCR
jgi:hypothetical protein